MSMLEPGGLASAYNHPLAVPSSEDRALCQVRVRGAVRVKTLQQIRKLQRRKQVNRQTQGVKPVGTKRTPSILPRHSS